ncbi:sulfurtransferase [Acrocarpospora macrocephala]|uniref:Sulfurtransferase n=1 Tax=Acrocarpospora macrocephala TaxID=150177 RepID=A0A5M3WDE2_9ACTN|nr:sulfurtransferase [Acrocarpospora macrocephala]GES07087.1 sulfurtransferase [Acrocarpospora macrocephala]
MTEAPLISAAELRQALGGPAAPVVLDIRWRLGGPSGAEEYAAGHIPGAVYLDLDRELAGPVLPGTGRHPLPDLATLEQTLRRAGVHNGTPLVVYDDAAGLSAARAWWLLRWSGLPDVRLLDGGLAAWTAAGGELTARTPDPPAGSVTLTPGALPTLTAGQAAALARTGILLDARAAERYRGEVEPVDPVAGHIPGAISAPTTANLAPDGRMLPARQLSDRFAALGVDRSRPVGVYCGSGVTAAHQVLALVVAGIDAALYPGSWSEWVTDPHRPVITGPDPG